jgi:heat shock protein HslJ
MMPRIPRRFRPSLLAFASTLILVVAACGSGELAPPSARDGHPGVLAGTSWRVVSVAGQTAIAGSEPTVVFAASTANGSAGCNSWFGEYAYDTTGALAFRQVGMTAMACAEAPKNAFEGLFITALNQATLASLDPRGLLVLSGAGGQIFLAVAGQPTPTD